MQPLEDAEELRRISHVEADAVVSHEVHPLAGPLKGTDLNTGDLPLPRELEGVVEEVGPHLTEQSRIGVAGR